MNRSLVMFLLLLIPAFTAAQQVTHARPAITGIAHVTFYADNLQKSQQFYGSLIGWQQIPAGKPESGVRFYANHLQYVQLVSPPAPGLEDRLVSVAFATSDAEALRSYLATHGVAVPPSVTAQRDGSISFQMKDPEGHTIEFTQAGPHEAGAPRPASMPLSNQIVHAGFVVRNRAALDHFYGDLLGFHLSWQGGSKPGQIEWAMMQVPNGTGWLEYMLYLPANPSRSQLGGANHFSPDVVSVAALEKKLEARGWKPHGEDRPPLLGLDGKWQLDLFDPAGTRVEFMEFTPVKTPCCSPITGSTPAPLASW